MTKKSSLSKHRWHVQARQQRGFLHRIASASPSPRVRARRNPNQVALPGNQCNLKGPAERRALRMPYHARMLCPSVLFAVTAGIWEELSPAREEAVDYRKAPVLPAFVREERRHVVVVPPPHEPTAPMSRNRCNCLGSAHESVVL